MKWYHPWNRLSLRETIVLLKYHAESPSKEHGGFDERTVGMSVAALRHISELRSCLKEAIAATDIRNLKRLEWMTVVSTKKPRRISVKPNATAHVRDRSEAEGT